MAHKHGVPIAEVAESGMWLGLQEVNIAKAHGGIHRKGIPLGTGFPVPVRFMKWENFDSESVLRKPTNTTVCEANPIKD